MPRTNKGSVFADKSRPGKWRAVLAYKGEKIWSPRFDGEQAAYDWIAEQKSQINNGTFIEPSEVTVGAWLVGWLNVYVKPKVRIRTYERYLVTLNHLEPLFLHKLQALDPHTVQKFYISGELSQSATLKAHKLLKSALKQAHNNQLIHRNPLTAIAAPAAPKTEIAIMPIEDINALLAFCKKHTRYSKHYPLFFLLANTGARIGEILALEWKNVNLEEQTITIAQALEYSVTLGTRITQPKTKAGNRVIPISSTVTSILAGLPRPCNFVFSTNRLTPFAANNIAKVWRAMFVDYNEQNPDKQIAYHHIHTLRHTHATLLIGQKNVSLADLSAYLGHAKISHTLDLYGHAIKKQTKMIADTVNNLYQDAD